MRPVLSPLRRLPAPPQSVARVYLNGQPRQVDAATPIRALACLSNIPDTDLVVVEQNGDRRLISSYPGRVSEHPGQLQLEEVASPVRGASAVTRRPQAPGQARIARLQQEAAVLSRRYRIRWDRDHGRWFIFCGVKLPQGYQPQYSDMAFSIPGDYPRVLPIGVFLAPELTLEGRPASHLFQRAYHRAVGQSNTQDAEIFGRGWSWLCCWPKTDRNPSPGRYGLDSVLGSALLMLTQLRHEARAGASR
jgi:hypothetical protein